MGLNTTVINDFSGGINYRASSEEMDSSEFDPASFSVEPVAGGKSIQLRSPFRDHGLTSTLPTVSANNRVASAAPMKDAGGGVSDTLIVSNVAGYIGRIAGAVNGLKTNPTVTSLLASASGLWSMQPMTDVANAQFMWLANKIDAPKKYNTTSGLIAWAGTPPNGNILKVWKNMMIVSGVTAQPQRLYFSAIANPESWPANNFIDIKAVDDEGDAITALEIVGEGLVVFKQNSTWVVFDPVTFDNRRLAPVGCVNPFATAKILDKIYWCGARGVYVTDGNDFSFVSDVFGDTFKPELAPDNVRLESYDTRLYVLTQDDVAYMRVMDTSVVSHGTRNAWWHWGNMQLSGDVIGTQPVVDGCSTISMIVRAEEPNTVGHTPKTTATKLYAFLKDPNSTAQRFGDITPVIDPNPTTVFMTPTEFINGVGFDIPNRYVSRWIPIQGVESYERLRRINLLGSGIVDVVVWHDFLIGNNTHPTPFFKSGLVIQDDNSLEIYAGVARVRPESRGRYHRVEIRLKPAVNFSAPRIDSVELKYRGGKEH